MQIAQSLTAPVSLSDAAKPRLVPGLAAGIAFLAIEIVAGQISTTAWAFPQAIAQTIGIGSPMASFDLTQVAAGVAIHIAFSLGLGLLFVTGAERLQLSGTRLFIAAVLFMCAESAVSIWLVLHTLFPETLPLLFSAVPFWASLLGRTSFGVVLAFTYVLTRRA